MKRMQAYKSCMWNIYVLSLVLITVASYPVQKSDLETQPELRNEKHFPNGTTIGKYTYVDNEGNPVHVKYYADDASYGVELNSIKVVDATGEPFPTTTIIQSTPSNFDPDSDAKTIAELLNTNRFPALQGGRYKHKMTQDYPNPYEFLNKELKSNRYKAEKPNPDYEVFYQNELKEPKKCSKEKVHVYNYGSKESRKMRSAANDLADADKFCEQF